MYRALLDLGPSTGYAVARAAGYARANAYAALEGLLRRGAAQRGSGRPARYRATDPQSLLVQLSGEQGERLDRLARAVAGLHKPVEPVTRVLDGSRAIGNVVQQLVARAAQRVVGVVAAELWTPTLPAWRHAARHAKVQVRISGDVADPEGLAAGRIAAGAPTTLMVDDQFTLVATGSGASMTALWSGHPLIALLARTNLGELA
jgi:HTH-type transcriptional regulator, sugar sensing transcriptional regulator